MADPSSSSSYRNTVVEEDDDDDDLDGLDDVLASFNAPRETTAPPSDVPPAASSSSPAPKSTISPPGAPGPENDGDFEASLVEGMESLLKQLAGDHPPGPMIDERSGPSVDESGRPSGAKWSAPERPGAPEGEQPLSPEEEEKAWQRAVEMMLSGEGLEALGLDASGNPTGKAKEPEPKPQAGSASGDAKPDFEETLRRTMEQLKAPTGRGTSNEGGAGNLASLLAQLGSDPSALAGLGEGDDELGGLLDGMMAQLMTKEVLEEPMSELASKYPDYLASPPSTTSPADLEKYRQQHTLVTQILDVFRRPGYTDEKDGKQIAKLVGEMQDLGGPPAEVMGELPEGFVGTALT